MPADCTTSCEHVIPALVARPCRTVLPSLIYMPTGGHHAMAHTSAAPLPLLQLQRMCCRAPGNVGACSHTPGTLAFTVCLHIRRMLSCGIGHRSGRGLTSPCAASKLVIPRACFQPNSNTVHGGVRVAGPRHALLRGRGVGYLGLCCTTQCCPSLDHSLT